MYIDSKQIVKIPVISSGSISVDKATLIGGFPRGRIVEVFGPESSGKTTLTLHLIAEAQKMGLLCAFIDAEHALDIMYAEQLGIDAKKVLLSQPDYGEQALEIVEKLVDTDEVGVIVIDSVAALTPKSEIEGDYGDAQMGVQARMMSQAMRKLTAKVHKSNTCVVFINQIREKIGVMFGSPETTTGGKALKFYASLRLETRYIGKVKQGEVQIASKTKITVKKNKLAPPFRVCEVEIRYGQGIDFIKEVIDHGVECGLIIKGGAWYTIGEDRFQGTEKIREFLSNNKDVTEYLRKEILNKEIKLVGGVVSDDEDDLELN